MNQFSLKWFQQRAFASLKPIAKGTWDYSDSLLVYVPQAVQAYEELQEDTTLYHSLVTKPEPEQIQQISTQIAQSLPDDFDYIDLGPGTEHKEKYLFTACQKLGKKFTYIPVDISESILSESTDFAAKQGYGIFPILSSFEDCEESLPKKSKFRFISLGLTFINYQPKNILSLLKKMIGQQGAAFINSQISDRVDLEKIKNIYLKQSPKIFDPKIRLLDLDPDSDIEKRETNHKVEIWYTLKNTNKKLQSLGVCAGDKLLVFQSLRHDLEFLKRETLSVFLNHQILDIGNSFVGFLLLH